MKCIISCEHASNRVPRRFSHLFQGKEKIMLSHQAFDPGAAAIALRIARRLEASAYLGSVTRLLVDLNRSPSNRKTLYTHYSRKLSEKDREQLFCTYYLPYREIIEREIGRFTAKGRPVIHISLHSFAPVKNGRVRRADVGLLYDPARRNEKIICGYLAAMLRGKKTSLRVRRNYPYQGKTDGFTSFLRKKHPAELYAGIEVEINQALLPRGNEKKKKVEEVLVQGFGNVLKQKDFARLEEIL